MLLIKRLGEAQIQLHRLQTVFVLQAGNFIQDLNFNALIRLQADNQFVLRQLLIGVAEQVQRRVLKYTTTSEHLVGRRLPVRR